MPHRHQPQTVSETWEGIFEGRVWALLLFQKQHTPDGSAAGPDVPEHPEHQTEVPEPEGLPETTLRPAPADFPDG